MTPEPTQPEMLVVEQCDREAALALMAKIEKILPRVYRDHMMAGRWDLYPAIQAFARHRLAERERAAGIVETMPERILEFWDRPGGPPGNGYRPLTRADLATAIRKGDLA